MAADTAAVQAIEHAKRVEAVLGTPSRAYALLTPKEQMFVNEAVKLDCPSLSEAARRAYPDLKQPEQAAARLRKKDLVRAAIAEIRAHLATVAGISREQMAREYATLGLYTETKGEISYADKLHALDSLSRLQGYMNSTAEGGGTTLEEIVRSLPPLQVNVQVNVEGAKNG